MHLPVYFFQGLGIWWWDHKTCPWKGFNHTTEGLKLPVFIISIGLQGQSLSTPHHFLWQKIKHDFYMTGQFKFNSVSGCQSHLSIHPITQWHCSSGLGGIDSTLLQRWDAAAENLQGRQTLFIPLHRWLISLKLKMRKHRNWYLQLSEMCLLCNCIMKMHVFL